MAPDAPQPVYNSNGNLVREWLAVIAYRPEQDALTLSWTQDGDLWQPAKQGAVAFAHTEMDDLLWAAESQLRLMHAPRLI